MKLENILLENYNKLILEKFIINEYNRLFEENNEDAVPGDPNKPQNINNPEKEWNDLRPNSKVGKTEDGEWYNTKIKTAKEAYDAAIKAKKEKEDSLPVGDEWNEYVQKTTRPGKDPITKDSILEPFNKSIETTKEKWLAAIKADRDSLRKEFETERNKYLDAVNADKKPQIQKIDVSQFQRAQTTEQTGKQTTAKPTALDKDFLKKSPAHIKDEEELNKINKELENFSTRLQAGKNDDGSDMSEDQKKDLQKSIQSNLTKQGELNDAIKLHKSKLAIKEQKQIEKNSTENSYFNSLPLYAKEERAKQIEELIQKRKDLKAAGNKSEDEIEAEIERLDAENKTKIKTLISQRSPNPQENEEIERKNKEKEAEKRELTSNITTFDAIIQKDREFSVEQKTAVTQTKTQIIELMNDETLTPEQRKLIADDLLNKLQTEKLPQIKEEERLRQESAQRAADALKDKKPEEVIKSLEEIREERKASAEKEARDQELKETKDAYFKELDRKLSPTRTRQFQEIEDLYRDPNFLAKSKEDQNAIKAEYVERHNSELREEINKLAEEEKINAQIAAANKIIKNVDNNATPEELEAAKQSVTNGNLKKEQIQQAKDEATAEEAKINKIYKDLDVSIKPEFGPMKDRIRAKRKDLQARKDNGEDIDIKAEMDSYIDNELSSLRAKNEDVKNSDKRTPEEKERDEKIQKLTPAYNKAKEEYLAAYTEKDDPELYALKSDQAEELKDIMLNPNLSDSERDELIRSKKIEHARAEVNKRKQLEETKDLLAGIVKIDPNETREKQEKVADENRKNLRKASEVTLDVEFDKSVLALRKAKMSTIKNSPAKLLKFSENCGKYDKKIDELRAKVKAGELSREDMIEQLSDYGKELDAELEKVDVKDEYSEATKAILDKKQKDYIDKFDATKEPELKRLKIQQFEDIKKIYDDKELSDSDRDKKIKELELLHGMEEDDLKQKEIQHKTELARQRADLSKDLKDLNDAEFDAYLKQQDTANSIEQKKSDLKSEQDAKKKIRDEYIKSLSPNLQIKFFEMNKEIDNKKAELEKKVKSGEISQDEMHKEIESAEKERDDKLKEEGEKAQKEKSDAQKLKERDTEFKKLKDSEAGVFASLSPGQKIVREKQLQALAEINTDSSLSAEERDQKIKELEKEQKEALDNVRFEEEKKKIRQKEFDKKFKSGDLTLTQLNRMQEQTKELDSALEEIDKRGDLSPDKKEKLKNQKREELNDKHLKEIESLDPANKAKFESSEANKAVQDLNNQIQEIQKKGDLTQEDKEKLDKLNSEKEEAENKAKEAENKAKQIEQLKKKIEDLQKKFDTDKENVSALIKTQKELTDAIITENDKDENPLLSAFAASIRNKNKIQFLKKLTSFSNSDYIKTKLDAAKQASKKTEETLNSLIKTAKNSTSSADVEKVEIEARKQEQKEQEEKNKIKELEYKQKMLDSGSPEEEVDKKLEDAKIKKEKEILDYKIQNLEKKLEGAKKAFERAYSEDSSNPAVDTISINVDNIEKSIQELKSKRSELGESFSNIDSYIMSIDFLIDNLIENIKLFT